ncbi:MAG: bifunctional sugar-1-phosphate nucleotidylyltransferase/acetyltransferase [Candidatus Hermodarchaeota archaeon]
MKAVILAAGTGTRLRPITATRPKPLIPVAGKPLLEHTILGLIDAGIDELLILVGYKKEMIKAYFGGAKEKFDIKINYLTQEEYLGTAHAAGYAKDFVRDDDFLLIYGDLLIDSKIFKELIHKFKTTPCEGLISLIEVNNPQNYGIISLDSNGFVKKITEKPSPDLNLGNLANAGIYLFKPNIFKAIEQTEKSIRGEYEFTDSMEILLNKMNGRIYAYNIKNFYWNDIGLPWQLLDANKYILENQKAKILGKVEKNVIISGEIYIGEGTVIKSGTHIQGPCFIGNNCLIGPNAFIRPYTSIGDNCHIGMSEAKNSLIFSNTAVPHFNYIGDSIVCENVNLGAGTKLSNLRFDNGNVKMNINGKLIDSGQRKLGAIIGPKSQTGINASIMCGKIIGENSVIGAHTLVNEDIPPNTLYYQDSDGKIIKKPNPFSN